MAFCVYMVIGWIGRYISEILCFVSVCILWILFLFCLVIVVVQAFTFA